MKYFPEQESIILSYKSKEYAILLRFWLNIKWLMREHFLFPIFTF